MSRLSALLANAGIPEDLKRQIREAHDAEIAAAKELCAKACAGMAAQYEAQRMQQASGNVAAQMLANLAMGARACERAVREKV